MKHTAASVPWWKTPVMIGAPLLIGSLLLMHPNAIGLSPEEWVQLIGSLGQRFLALHIVLLPLWPILALIVLWMLPQQGTPSRVSRIALAVYIVLYPAFDALVGIGSGVLIDYRATLNAAGQAVLDPAIQLLFFDPTGVPELLAIAGSVAWIVAAIAAAAALWRPAGWRVAVPLVISGVLMAWGHTWPMGPAANVALAVAAWQFLVQQQRSARTSSVSGQPTTEGRYAAGLSGN
jgi:hypothetical protein